MSKKVEWTEEYSVGITKLDDHHKLLFSIINDIQDSLDQGEAADLTGHFKALVDYTDYHFTAEETVMKKMNYPEMEEHVQQHRAFLEKVVEFQKHADLYGPNVMIKQMTEYLTAWLTSHILILDDKYEKFLLDFD